MRLVAFDGPGGNGRVHVSLARCPVCDGGCPEAGPPPSDDGSAPEAGDGGVADAPVDAPAPEVGPPPGMCTPLPALPDEVASLTVTSVDATSATITFVNADAAGQMVDGYDIRYRIGAFMGDGDFDAADPAPFVQPGAPGEAEMVTVPNLKPGLTYVVGVRSLDACSQHSGIATVSFLTPAQKFTQLSGCFVATAAYGSTLEPEVASLRRARDRLRAASPLFASATDLYYRSGPAAAAVVGESSLLKGVARRVIAPFAGLAEAMDALGSAASRR
jgi:hypothetical protein